MEAISRTKRTAVLADCDSVMGTLAVSIKHQVSTAWVRRLKQRRRETGVRLERRELADDEIRWFLESAHTGSECFGLTGFQRFTLYLRNRYGNRLAGERVGITHARLIRFRR